MFDIGALMQVERARGFVAEQLKEGALAVFLGAGVSMAVGLPGWGTLARRCGLLAGIGRRDLSRLLGSEEYAEALSEVERRAGSFNAYCEIVRTALYRRFPGVAFGTCQTPLLIALGSLVSGGPRGRVDELVSLNFDDVLESYFLLHGYKAQSVARLPYVIRSDRIHIYHVHGFLAHPERSHERGDHLVFSRRAADEFLSSPMNHFRLAMRRILMSKVCLFVGMSEKTARDYVLSPLLREAEGALRDRPTGFWFLRRPVDEWAVRHLREYNVVPLVFDEHHEMAAFLLSVCELAGRGVGGTGDFAGADDSIPWPGLGLTRA